MTTVIEDQLRRAVLTIRNLKQEVADLRARDHEPIAVVGLGCRLPGDVDSPDTLWRMLVAGTDAIVTVPSGRWDADQWFDPDPDRPGRMNSRWGGFLPGIDRFDPAFFELSAREATAMDPQQRLLLEVAWEALEDACLDPSRLNGSPTGVFVGINASEYLDAAMAVPDTLDAHALSGGVASVAAGRLSFLMGFSGPSMAVDTACSSSLTAIHLAIGSLRTRESNLALAGGVYTVLRPNLTVALSKLHMMAPDGRCKSFDAAADGFVQGEGCVLVALKRLSDALADGDPIRAVIRGSAANQDGRSGSLTAPSRDAQNRVIRAALGDAGLAADRVGYVETHGTGTALGDPIEVHALIDAMGPERCRPLVLGALKSNIGHLGPAAGAAGLAKAVLALQHGQIPANRHFRHLNPNIELGGFPAQFPDQLTGWPVDGGIPDEERVAAVSSFGFSGTNVHMVLGQAPQPTTGSASPLLNGLSIMAVSARTPAALNDALHRMIAALDDGCDFAGMAATSLLGRRAFEYRVAVVADSAASARALLAERLKTPVAAVPQRARLGLWSAASAEWCDRLAGWGVAPAATEGAVVEGAARLRDLGCSVVLSDRGEDGSGVPQLPLTGTGQVAMAGLLARLYEIGIAVDWRMVVGSVRRARLPTYPFQRKSCWRSLDVVATPPTPAGNPPGDRVMVPGDDWHFRLPLSLGAFQWLADHRVHGRTLVPGAMQISCLAGAWWARHGRIPCRMSDVTFAQPLLLPDSGVVEVCTSLRKDGAALLTSPLADGGGDWQTHADARMSPGLQVTVAGDLAGWQRRCTLTVAPDVWRQRLAGIGIAIGPAFHGIQTLWSGEGEALARLALPPSMQGVAGATSGLMHPVLLDACLQVAGGALSDSLQGEALLPVGIDMIEIDPDLADGMTTLWAHARLTAGGAVISTDVTVVADDGRVVLAVRGLHVRRAPASSLATPARAPDTARLFHRLTWQAARPVSGQRPLLLVVDTTTAPQFAGSGNLWNPAGPEPLQAALARLGGQAEIVDLQGWSLAVDSDPLALAAPAFALIGQVSALARAGGPVPSVYTLVARPGQGVLSGLAATLALEQPDWQPRCLIADRVDDVAAGLAGDPAETLLRAEHGRVEVARLTADRGAAAGNVRLSGCVVITGGLGGLGRRTARWAAARGAGTIVLIGRSVAGAAADEFVASLPCPVRRIAVDMADPAFAVSGAKALLRQLMADGLPPRAIFHSAGVQQPGLLAELTGQDFAASLAAKAGGAWALHRAALACRLPLEHFVMFSSLAGVLGAAGQGGYGAANAALDELARQRRAMGLPGLSVGWGRLDEAGMATVLDAASLARIDALGLRAISPDQAMAALDQVLASGLADPVVADVDWRRFAARHPSGRVPPLLAELAEPVVSKDGGQDDRLSWLRAAAAAILGADAADMPTDRPLFQLGLDSLMAVELRNRITAAWGRGPSIALLLGGASLTGVVDALAPETPVAAPVAGDAVDPSDEWEELTL